MGTLYARMRWDDGHEEDVAYDPIVGVEELTVDPTSDETSDYVAAEAPVGGSKFWQVGVAIGAFKVCHPALRFVSWKVCGATIEQAALPMFLDLPDPTGIELTFDEPKVTSAWDDASLPPISLPTSTGFHLTVSWTDGSVRTFSNDSRVSYSVAEHLCGSISRSSQFVGMKSQTCL